MRKILFLFSVILLTYICALGQRSSLAISLVPAKSVAVVRVDWTKVRSEQQLRQVVKGDEFANIIAQTGTNEASVREFVIFADVNPSSSGKMGMIVSGDFSSSAVVRSVVANGWRSEEVGTRIAYVNPSDGSYLMTLSGGMFVEGTKTAVKQTGETLDNPRSALIRKAAFRSIMSQLGSSAPVAFFLGVPEEYQGIANFAFKVTTKLMSFTGLGILGMVFDKIGLIQSLGFSMNAGHGSNPVKLVAAMRGKTEAVVASGALNLLKRGASLLSRSDADMTALKSITFGNAGNLLSVRMDLPQSVMTAR